MTTSKTVKPTEKIKQLLKDLKWAGKDGSTMFNLLAGINRPVTPAHVTKISTSIQKNGNARAVVIVRVDFLDGVMKNYIIDGQHLFFALLRNNMDIPYVIMDVKNKQELVETIALLNTSSKSWTTLDYVSAWASIIPDYKVLNEIYNIYDLELGQIAELAHTGTLAVKSKAGAGGVYGIVKRGELRIQDKESCMDKLNKVQDALSIVPRMDRVSNTLFVASYVHVITVLGNKYNHKNFLAYLKEHKNEFRLVTQDAEEVQKLLNKAAKNKK